MTGYITEILGDDRIWETGLSEQALTGWPLMYEYANLAIMNNTTDQKVVINPLNTRPFTGPNHAFPTIRMGNITAYSGGTTLTPFSFDSFHPTTTTSGIFSRGITPMVTDATQRERLLTNLVAPVARAVEASPHRSRMIAGRII